MNILSTKHFQPKTFLTLAGFALLFAAPASVRAQTLLAGWTFNNQSSQAASLTADLGTLAGTATFATGAGGSGATYTMNGDGTVTLGSGEFLTATSINSTSFSSLTSNVTIWASFTVLGSPSTNNNGAFIGLLNAAPAMAGTTFYGTSLGSFGYEILNSNSSSTAPTVRSVGVLSSGTVIAPGSTYNTVSVGTQTSGAIVFNATGGTGFTYFDYVNGTVNSRSSTSATPALNSFTSLSVGRLNAGTLNYTTGLVLNEIRVYEGSLTVAQLNAIAPVPEPSIPGLLAGGVVLTMLRSRRRAALRA